MWPFKRTLSERYSKLVKLIKSIDSHFQMTENKEDSLRLHLPNYKGNQPMDFHIYLMEPFLFISFITEIEGEKISCVNNFPKDTDQQDMFNLAMSNNLNKIHQVLEDKYSEDGEEKKDDGKEETDGNHNSVTSNNDSSDETWGLRDYYDFNESFKKHALTIMILRRGIEFRYFASKNDYTPKWSYNIDWEKIQSYNCPSGAEPLVWIMKHYDNREDFCWLLEVLDEQIAHLWVESMEEPEILIGEIQKYVPQFKLKNNPQQVKVNLGWSWIDIQAILHFIDYCSHQQNKLLSTPEEVKPLQECATIEDISRLYWSDYTKEQHSQKEKAKEGFLKKEEDLSDSSVVHSWSLLDFAKTHGKMQVGDFVNKETGEEFKACIFINPHDGTRTFVAFSIKLGELTPKQIADMKNELQVVQLESGNYSLCKIDSGWKDVDLEERLAAVTWTDEYGAEYSLDRKRLIHVPGELKKYSIREGVEEIGDYAFCECFGLKYVLLPNSLIKIGKNSFEGCFSLREIVIPQVVKTIEEWAFHNCENLVHISLSSSLERIENSVFAECYSLNDILIPSSVKYLGHHLFFRCKALNKINIPDSVAIINDGLFYGCESLKQIEFPNSILEIGEDVFGGCKQLSTIKIPEGTRKKFELLLPYCKDILVEKTKPSENKIDNIGIWIDEHGVKYDRGQKLLLNAPKDIKKYIIIEGTKAIDNAAFSNCEDLVSVSIPNSITKIGHYAFAGCKKIFSLIIPRGVKSIGDGAFMNCETLKSLRLSEGLVSISDDAFDGCNNLNTIFVPVEEKNRFEAMLSKFDVNIAEYNNDNVSALDEILSGLLDESGVLYSKDGKTVFTHTKGLSSYSLKTGTEIINAKAFSPIDGVDNDNISLKEIILPNSITTIWDFAFAYNEGLQEISLPSSIKTIGKDVFKGCKSLRSIRIPHGTRTKFERLLPEWKDLLVEKSNIVSDTLSNFELPDGSIYNGGCLRNPFGSVVLNGIGSLTYLNGDKYKGNFKNGRPYGWGIYWFQNGHKYKGYFDEHPKGIGYLNEDYDMAVGNFYEGRLQGWAICYRNKIFKFGYWENGKLFKDETNKTLWVRCEISKLRTQSNGNLIQISQDHEFIRFGIPERTINMEINNPNSPKWPAIGFEFFKDGTVKVGEISNNSSGEYILCKINGTMEYGHWKDNVKDADKTLTDFQEPIDLYEVDGLDVWHCYR